MEFKSTVETETPSSLGSLATADDRYPRPEPKPPDVEPEGGQRSAHIDAKPEVPFGGWVTQQQLTGMNYQAWKVFMHSSGYAQAFPEQARLILEGITRGVDIGFQGKRDIVRECRNPRSTEEPAMRDLITSKIQKDVAAGKKLGPFQRPPFKFYWISPIRGVIKVGKKIRVVFNLSFPHGGESVNSGIPDQPCKLARFDDAMDAIRRLGKGCFLIKLDVEAAYKQIPVRFEDWPLLMFKWEGQYYIDATLPMGLKPSCLIWEYYATALEWIFRRCAGIEVVVHYIDDFLFVVKLKDTAKKQLATALNLCKKLGVPIAPEKTEGPTTKLTFLGIELDTEAMVARVPEEHLLKLNQLLSSWETRTHATKSELQALSGYLNFITKVVRAGRSFSRRIIDQYKALIGKPEGSYPINEEIQRDIQWWKSFMPTWSGHSVLYDVEWSEAPLIEFFTDACDDYGYGAYFQGRWISAPWTEEEIQYSLIKRGDRRSRSMPFLEMLGLTYAVATFGHLWAGRKITFRSDCLPVVQAIEKGSTPKRKLMQLLRHLQTLAARHAFVFRCVHIAGLDNQLADALSRNDLQGFRRLCPQANLTPEQIVPLPPFESM